MNQPTLEQAMTELAARDYRHLHLFTHGRWRHAIETQVCRHLASFGRYDAVADRTLVDACIHAAALDIAHTAPAWNPGGTAPWAWARAAIRHSVAVELGDRHDRLDEPIDGTDGLTWADTLEEPAPPPAHRDVTLNDLDHPVAARLAATLTQMRNQRHVAVHIDYRLARAAGDRWASVDVGARHGMTAAAVRQADYKIRRRLAADPELAVLPWVAA